MISLITVCIYAPLRFACGVVVEVCEMFGSESKSQVYAHLHSLLASGKLSDVGKFLK